MGTTRTKSRDGLHMHGCAVPRVRAKAVPGRCSIEPLHHAIARGLSNDRRRRNRGTRGIALNERAVRSCLHRQREAVDEELGPLRCLHQIERAAEAAQIGGLNPNLIDLRRRDRDHGNRDRSSTDDDRELSATSLRKLLRIVEALQRREVFDRERRRLMRQERKRLGMTNCTSATMTDLRRLRAEKGITE